jgi:hypothetical protein
MITSAIRLAHSLSILAGRSIISTKVGRAVASEAGLSLQSLGDSVGGIADEHAEALYAVSGVKATSACRWLTGLKAVT